MLMSLGNRMSSQRVQLSIDNAVFEHNCAKMRPLEDHTYCSIEPAMKQIRTRTDILKSLRTTNQIRKKKIRLETKSWPPICAILYKEYIKSCRQSEITERAHAALNFLNENSYEELTENMNLLVKKKMWKQIKQYTRKTQGRRFSIEEKLTALTILKQSPGYYKLLSKIFILPTKNSINQMVTELNIEAGINSQVFDAVRQEVTTWEENKKYCSILVDEFALESILDYKRDSKPDDVADRALVFMLRGALYKWHHPLAFYFFKGEASAVQLEAIIKDVVTAIANTGLVPVALVCGQGRTVKSALSNLQEDMRREQIGAGLEIDDVISINGHSLSVFHDPPNLMKILRNEFLTKDIKYENKIATWNDIMEVYRLDRTNDTLRVMPKLNDECVIPDKIDKMKLKNCVRVLSNSVASTLVFTAQFSEYADGRRVSPTMQNTGEMVAFFDDLFDSVNGINLLNSKIKRKPLQRAVTATSQHYTFWSAAIQKLQSIQFIDSTTDTETSLPLLKHWVVTLKSYQRLWRFFQKKNIKVLRPRLFNTDPLEKFFRELRANYSNCDSNKPTPAHTFKNIFKSVLITRFVRFHENGYDCEVDSDPELLLLKILLKTNDSQIVNNEQ